MSTSRIVRCMYSDAQMHDSGGVATVRFLDGIPVEQTVAAAERFFAGQEAQTYTAVFIAGSQGSYVAESFSPQGTRIQLCGHGALATAWLILNDYEPHAASLSFSNQQHAWQARKSYTDDANITLTYPRPELVDIAVPDFVGQCLGVQSLAATEAGGATDYLILELADESAVQSIQPDFAAMCVASKRAFIVTARSNDIDRPGCVFRYFAPQYGNPEDAATGSAGLQLAAYWSSRLNVEKFTARQLSNRGAVLQLGYQGDTVELATRVRYSY